MPPRWQSSNTVVCTRYPPCESASRSEVGAHALALNTLDVGARFEVFELKARVVMPWQPGLPLTSDYEKGEVL